MDLEALIPFIIIGLSILFGAVRRRKHGQSTSETETQAEQQAEVDQGFPPFIGNFDDFPQEVIETEAIVTDDEQVPVVAQQSEPDPVHETIQEKGGTEPPPVPPNLGGKSPTGTMPFPTASLIDISPDTFRQGIILAEILGKPKALQRRK